MWFRELKQPGHTFQPRLRYASFHSPSYMLASHTPVVSFDPQHLYQIQVAIMRSRSPVPVR